MSRGSKTINEVASMIAPCFFDEYLIDLMEPTVTWEVRDLFCTWGCKTIKTGSKRLTVPNRGPQKAQTLLWLSQCIKSCAKLVLYLQGIAQSGHTVISNFLFYLSRLSSTYLLKVWSPCHPSLFI